MATETTKQNNRNFSRTSTLTPEEMVPERKSLMLTVPKDIPKKNTSTEVTEDEVINLDRIFRYSEFETK